MATFRMMKHHPQLAALVLTVIVATGLVSCGGGSKASPTQQSTTGGAGASAVASPTNGGLAQATATATANLKTIKVTPDTGHIGDKVALSADGLPANASVEFIWSTFDGDFVTKILPADVQYIDRQFPAKRVSLGKVQADAQGHTSFSFTAPDDYGETHNIFAVVDGQDTARGGFRILRTVEVSPKEGAIGAPVTVTVKGLGVQVFESTMAVLYDQKYTGMITGVRTQGTATFQFRAAGPVGAHDITVIGAATAIPFLNNEQSPTGYIPWTFNFPFTVTADNGAPASTVEFPKPSAVAQLGPDDARTGQLSTLTADQHATMDPAFGPILSHSTLKASHLPANADVDLVWVTAAGSDVSGWDVSGVQLSRVKTGADGSLSVPVDIPDGLGGWHVIEITQGDKLLAEAPYRVDRSIVGVSTKKVKAGDTFQVEIKGAGWTQIDNGVAVDYDNAFIGFACGFGSGGDVTINLVATGGPGTHIIDIYPMIYQGARGLMGTAKPPWTYMMPYLTALQDYPGLELGYNLPIFRMAVEITPMIG